MLTDYTVHLVFACSAFLILSAIDLATSRPIVTTTTAEKDPNGMPNDFPNDSDLEWMEITEPQRHIGDA